MTAGTTTVQYQGISYTPFPIQFTGISWDGSKGTPPKPSLIVSNVSHYLINDLVNLGDLCGATLTRIRTFAKFLDGASNADPAAHFPPDTFLVDQKTMHNRNNIQWTLTMAMDKPGMMLPAWQVLTDQGFSGVNRAGLR